MIAHWDKDFVCEYSSPNVPELVCRPVSDFIGKHKTDHFDWIYPDDQTITSNMVPNIQKSKLPVRFRVRMLSKDNRTIMSEHLLMPRMSNGGIMGYTGFGFELKRESDKAFFE